MARQLKQPQYKRFRYNKRIKHNGPKLSGAWKLLINSIKLIKRNWKLFGGVILVYGLLNLLFVRGFSSAVDWAALEGSDSITTFNTLVSSDGASQVAGVYQTILMLVGSLALIWLLRQLTDDTKDKAIRIRDAFYKGMYPLVPFLLVLGVITLQLLPLAIGASIYSLIVGNGLAVSAIEKAIWFSVFILFAVWTLYLLSSSIFAAYIVTLPNMTPMKALRSAKKLVQHRRWALVRKILFLPVAIFIILGVVMVPIIAIAPPLAEWVLFGLNMIFLAVVHTYFYSLYREML